MTPPGVMMMRPARPLPSAQAYALRIIRGVAIGLGVVGAGLAVGTVGYRATEHLSWLDGFLNASMLLAGEGPVATLHTSGGKLFASFYAVFSGVLFITAISTGLAPVVHRFLHRFHLEVKDEGAG